MVAGFTFAYYGHINMDMLWHIYGAYQKLLANFGGNCVCFLDYV